MVIEDLGLGVIVSVGTAVAARMGELQSNKRRIGAIRAFAVRPEQRVPQFRQPRVCMRADDELIRIRTPPVRDGDGFPSPDEAGTAGTEPSPPAKSVFAGVAVGKRVPAFHGLHGDTIPELE